MLRGATRWHERLFQKTVISRPDPICWHLTPFAISRYVMMSIQWTYGYVYETMGIMWCRSAVFLTYPVPYTKIVVYTILDYTSCCSPLAPVNEQEIASSCSCSAPKNTYYRPLSSKKFPHILYKPFYPFSGVCIWNSECLWFIPHAILGRIRRVYSP